MEDMNALLIKDAGMLKQSDLETFISSVDSVCVLWQVLFWELGYKGT